MPAFSTILNSCFFLVPRIGLEANRYDEQLKRNGGVAHFEAKQSATEKGGAEPQRPSAGERNRPPDSRSLALNA